MTSTSGAGSCCSSVCHWTLCVRLSLPAIGLRHVYWLQQAAAAPAPSVAPALLAATWHSCLARRLLTTPASSYPLLSAACGSSCCRPARLQRRGCCQVCTPIAVLLLGRLVRLCMLHRCTCLPRTGPSPHFLCGPPLSAVCLRGLAAADAGCRAAAYQAVALFEAQLPAPAAAHGFREAQQLRCGAVGLMQQTLAAASTKAALSNLPCLTRCIPPLWPCSVLLGALRAAVNRPFQRLPAVHAVFLAEAGRHCQLCLPLCFSPPCVCLLAFALAAGCP